MFAVLGAAALSVPAAQANQQPGARTTLPTAPPKWIAVTLTISPRCPSAVTTTATIIGSRGATFYYRFHHSAGQASALHTWSQPGAQSASVVDIWTGAPQSGWVQVEAYPWPPAVPVSGVAPFPPGPTTTWTAISDQSHFSRKCVAAPVAQ
jgi:hypothetical protein